MLLRTEAQRGAGRHSHIAGCPEILAEVGELMAIRSCNGQDENLIKYVHLTDDKTGKTIERAIPCDCGLVFDDARRVVIHPHDWIDR
jgi:hypothetical protein